MSKDEVFLAMAVTLGQLGTCDRAKVGAIITFNGRAISWGYNGAPEGLPHCAENQHGWLGVEEAWGERLDGWVNEHGCRNATHAEANAIAFAARQGISTVGGTLYVETSPCLQCARLIIAAGIQRVVYSNTYRLTEGLDLLEMGGIELAQSTSYAKAS